MRVLLCRAGDFQIPTPRFQAPGLEDQIPGRGGGEGWAQELRAHGAVVTVSRLLRILPSADTSPLDAALTRVEAYDWVVFTSANAVSAVFTRMCELELDFRAARPQRVAVIGPATAAAVTQRGWSVSLAPVRKNSAGLIDSMRKLSPGVVLLPQSDLADDKLEDGLRDAGFAVTRVVAYRTVVDETEGRRAADLIASASVDSIVFTSPSTVHALFGVDSGMPLPPVVCIGASTAGACAHMGIRVAMVAESPTPEAVVAAVSSVARGGAGRHEAAGE